MSQFRYTEINPIFGQVEHLSMIIEIELIIESEKSDLFEGFFKKPGPWYSCKSNGYPTMIFSEESVKDILHNPPMTSNFLKLCVIENKKTFTSLYYCKKYDLLANAENKIYSPVMIKHSQLSKFATNNYLWEPSIMAEIEFLSDEERRKHPFVDWRINSWSNGYVLPQQYLNYSWGNAVHLLRLMRVYGIKSKQAWDLLWTGKF